MLMETMCNQVVKPFSVLCLFNMVRLCCSLVFTIVEEAPVSSGVQFGFGSLVGGIARLGTERSVRGI